MKLISYHPLFKNYIMIELKQIKKNLIPLEEKKKRRIKQNENTLHHVPFYCVFFFNLILFHLMQYTQ